MNEGDQLEVLAQLKDIYSVGEFIKDKNIKQTERLLQMFNNIYIHLETLPFLVPEAQKEVKHYVKLWEEYVNKNFLEFKKAVKSVVLKTLMENCPLPFQGTTSGTADKGLDTWNSRFGEFTRVGGWRGINSSQSQYKKSDGHKPYISGEQYDRLADAKEGELTERINTQELAIKQHLGLEPSNPQRSIEDLRVYVEGLRGMILSHYGESVYKYMQRSIRHVRKTMGNVARAIEDNSPDIADIEDEDDDFKGRAFEILWRKSKSLRTLNMSTKKKDLAKELETETMIKFFKVYIPLVQKPTTASIRPFVVPDYKNFLMGDEYTFEDAGQKLGYYKDVKEGTRIVRTTGKGDVKDVIRCAFPFYVNSNGERFLAVEPRDIIAYVLERSKARRKTQVERRSGVERSGVGTLKPALKKLQPGVPSPSKAGRELGDPLVRAEELEQRIANAYARAGKLSEGGRLGVDPQYLVRAKRRIGEGGNVEGPMSSAEEQHRKFFQKVFIF